MGIVHAHGWTFCGTLIWCSASWTGFYEFEQTVNWRYD